MKKLSEYLGKQRTDTLANEAHILVAVNEAAKKVVLVYEQAPLCLIRLELSPEWAKKTATALIESADLLEQKVKVANA